MIAHILPCVLEAEILGAVTYLVAHAREVLALITAWRKTVIR